MSKAEIINPLITTMRQGSCAPEISAFADAEFDHYLLTHMTVHCIVCRIHVSSRRECVYHFYLFILQNMMLELGAGRDATCMLSSVSFY